MADADVNTRLNSKIVTFTRDISLTTDLSITGVGFSPTAMIGFAKVDSQVLAWTIGVSDSSVSEAQIVEFQADTITVSAKFLSICKTSTDFNDAYVKTYDADGFTLSWTKSGSPTGTATVYIICFR